MSLYIYIYISYLLLILYIYSSLILQKKLRKLELKMKENLAKEGKRRQEAEYTASKLKKKVSELTFLLNERDGMKVTAHARKLT